ncbi:MAG: hypothetical protein IK130_00165 [Oscillospiraceae bacterium]|nr:hypothetical protein [Oscillospiraceae bacterium]
MKHFLMSGIAAVLCALLMLPVCPSLAAAYSLNGDISGDSAVTAEDAVLLRDFLCGDSDVFYSYLGDMDGNGMLDARDLTLLKRRLSEPETPAERIPAPISVLSPPMPSTGDVRLLIVMADFPDCRFSHSIDTEQIRAQVFGEQTSEDPPYPLDSIRAYYERASYGRLHIDGDVYRFSVNRPIYTYAEHPDWLADTVLAGLDAEIDYHDYDADSDGRIDTLMIAVPESASDDKWWPYSINIYSTQRYDGLRLANLCIGNTPIDAHAEFISTWTHELGHAMELPDYYYYENVTDDNYYGFRGDAGWEMMDKAQCDLCAFSKLMLGWYQTDEVAVYTGGTQSYALESSQRAPGCLVIPRGDLNGYVSEYFVVEFAEPIGNNTYFYADNAPYIPFKTSGIRVMHCDATVVDTYSFTKELKWNNYGQFYDSSNLRQRVIRLANNREGGYFYEAGDCIDGNISGFHWYDENGFETVDTGIRIFVTDDNNGVYTVMVTDE